MPRARSPGFAERCDLAREHIVEADVIAGRSQRGTVGRQRDRSNGIAILLVANGQLRGEMLGSSCAATIAEQKDFTTVPNTANPGL